MVSYLLAVYREFSKVPIYGHRNGLSLLLLTCPTPTTRCSPLLLLQLRKAAFSDLVDVSRKAIRDVKIEGSTSSRSASDMMDCWDGLDAAPSWLDSAAILKPQVQFFR